MMWEIEKKGDTVKFRIICCARSNFHEYLMDWAEDDHLGWAVDLEPATYARTLSQLSFWISLMEHVKYNAYHDEIST